MTKDEYTRIFRIGEWPDFYRLTKGLRAIKIDFKYAETRKLLEPNWDPYNMPPGHDIIEDYVDINDANLVTSQVIETGLHRVLLDLDRDAILNADGIRSYGTELIHYNHLTLAMNPIWPLMDEALLRTLNDCKITTHEPPSALVKRHADGTGILDLHTLHDCALIPSSTPGHHHLIMATDLPWQQYCELLNIFSTCGIVEEGYKRASIKKGYAALRPPWVHK